MFNKHSVEIDWGGRPLKLETGKIARQADGAVVATYGETVVLATVVAAKSPREGDAGLPPDRPSDPSAVRRRLAQRDPGDRHRAVARHGERSGYRRSGGLVRRTDPVRRALQGPDRCSARRLRQ